MKNFDNKVVLITGSGSGLGKDAAIAFAKLGASVVVSDVNVKGGEEVVEEIKKLGGESIFVKADVSKKEEVQNLIKNTIQKYSKLDIAVNNAGIGGPFKPTTMYTDEDWDRVIAINQTGVFYCLREELKVMAAQKSGVIVNISSIAGLRAMGNGCAYVASKHAVVGLTKATAVEYARFNIRVNAVCPVFTKTPLVEQLLDVDPAMEKKLIQGIPMRRYGEPADMTNAILWLCEESSAFVTGLCLPIDGGMMA
ncbi:MAG: glucose 1-dehydrogenase [Bacteroidetes bacterium]|jgi:NAD(P)-dependent dehydrogenase (short-subunit alcohol dehydrogenase family)|nr:glucose 1-dehydrogenase [Bacteroidota bacterium]MDF1863430.1 glucose 1-dehydrogenase [Saprospiraceae bacterium]